MENKKNKRALEKWDPLFDPVVNLVKIPLTATYHTALKKETTPEVHGIYVSVIYAFDLLESHEPDRLERALAILQAVLPLQDKNPERDSYGIWPYFLEETLDEMDKPDWNMADFHGKKLLLLVKRHAHRLPHDMIEMLKSAIERACQAIMKRDVGPGYTNIAIMGAFVTLAGGELLGNEHFRMYGLQRLRRFHEFTFGIGTFTEYNSPTYSMIALNELHSISKESATAEATLMADELIRLAWRMVGRHYHVPTGQWGGPHSRSYATLLDGTDIRKFLDDAIQPSRDPEDQQCPDDLLNYFTTIEERWFSEQFNDIPYWGFESYATTYMTDQYTVGSMSKSFMWNQRRNVIAYIANDGQPAYAHVRFLVDGADFCSALLTSVQNKNELLYGFNMVTDSGAWHADLDPIHGRFLASDLRIRLELGGHLIGIREPEIHEDQNQITTQIGEVKIQARLLASESEFGIDRWEIVKSEEGCYLDYVIYSGVERAFDLHKMQAAIWLFQLVFGDKHGTVKVEKAIGRLSALHRDPRGENMCIDLVCKPGKIKDLYLSNTAQLPPSLHL